MLTYNFNLTFMLEYLILNNRFEAAFKYNETSNKNYKEELLFHFNKGKRVEFFKLFSLFRKEDKLEFYIRVYFFIYSLHPNLKAKTTIPEDQVNAFREFLDTQGADLAKTNEFLEFYALPFVKKPLEHASFKVLFKKEWVNNLTEKIHIFLQEEQKRMKQSVDLLFNHPKEDSERKKLRSPEFNQPVEPAINVNLKLLEEKNKKLFEQVENYRIRFSALEKNNQALIESFNSHLMESQNKWFQITRELTNNSRTLIQLISKSSSSIINDRKYQRIKKRTQKFEKIVKKELEELLNQSQDLSVFDKPSVNEISHSASFTPNISQRNATTFVSIDEFIPTNYVSLIKDFKKMNDDQKIKVLQGFSWRIIKSKNKWIRRQTIVGLIVNDVLGLMNGDIQSLLFNESLTVYVVKLFLYISEDLYGSKVLFRNGGLYKEIIDLIPVVIREKNYLCLGVILEILQNIWHNKQILLELINLNIIDICVNILLEDERIRANDELLQSISTLLLNASAVKEGLDSFQTQINIFFSLCEAFKDANDSNRNLLGAIMYGLLGRKEMWKLAHEAKLPNFIDDMLKGDFRSNKQQLLLLQERLQTFQNGMTMETQYYEDDSIDSNLQEEIFQRNEEELTDLQEYIKGDQTLKAKYFLRGKEADKQIDQINKIMDQFKTKNQEHINKEKRIVTAHEKANQRYEEKQKMQHVRLPEIKQKKQEADISQKQVKSKINEKKEYYSYKSPNFKQQEQKNSYSIQVQSLNQREPTVKERIHSFEVHHQEVQDRRINRANTKPLTSKIEIKRQEDKKQGEKKSSEKPEYRIKKSSSVEKGLSIKKQYITYDANKNNSNIEYKNIEGIKSPPPKRTRQEVLRQLNQQLRAKKAVQQERKVSIKNLPANSSPVQRENTHVKQNNFTGNEQERKVFDSKPKIRRTPPKDEDIQ